MHSASARPSLARQTASTALKAAGIGVATPCAEAGLVRSRSTAGCPWTSTGSSEHHNDGVVERGLAACCRVGQVGTDGGVVCLRVSDESSGPHAGGVDLGRGGYEAVAGLEVCVGVAVPLFVVNLAGLDDCGGFGGDPGGGDGV